MNDREFWLMFRSALLMIVSAIERRYKIGKYSDCQPVAIGENDSVT